MNAILEVIYLAPHNSIYHLRRVGFCPLPRAWCARIRNARHGLRSAGLKSESWLQPPKTVGEVDYPVLEPVRRLFWRALDRVSYCFVLIRLSIHDRICGSEPPTPADLKREADHERLDRAFPMAGETIEPSKNATSGKIGTAK